MIKYLSNDHRNYLDALFERVQVYYGGQLVSLAIFGSYARRENRLNSDLDLLIILHSPEKEGRLKRMEAFVKFVEIPLDPQRALFEKDGFEMEISPLILNDEESRAFLPLYLDMVKHHILIVDHEDFLKKKLKQVEEKMQRWGSRKKEIGGHWYWEIKPGLKWGEVLDYDQ